MGNDRGNRQKKQIEKDIINTLKKEKETYRERETKHIYREARRKDEERRREDN